jgi:carboxymethylenebutenolidase
MRDEGLRYDPELAYSLYGLVFDLFHRKLSEGDQSPPVTQSTETRH